MKNLFKIRFKFSKIAALKLEDFTRSLFYKGWLIRDGNMGLVGIQEFLGDEH